jgi:acetolactate synthase-1/2/3 large subunit
MVIREDEGNSNLAEYSGADLIADFIAEKCSGTAFLVTGGACAFIVDSVGQHSKASYECFQHEQAAAMAADAVWRTTGKIGVTISTSGPGATNLITGIACSWFDSIPSIHITGQVNQSESRDSLNVNVRQAGFQETDIVAMVSPITKFSIKVESIEQLVETLPKLVSISTSGRMGPVLMDVPMNIQKAPVSASQRSFALSDIAAEKENFSHLDISKMMENSKRAVVVIGAGAALSGSARTIQDWCEENKIPYVSSWGALTYLDRSAPGYFGSIGVYGARAANWLIQASDCLVVMGSRLDNRQRTGNPKGFAPYAIINVIDIDLEELGKFKKHENYRTFQYDLRFIGEKLVQIEIDENWINSAKKKTLNMDEGFEHSVSESEFNPYFAVRALQHKFKSDAIVVSDCGANLCWVYQSYLPDSTFLFTAGGNSPMGYSLPAAIGAQLANPEKKVYCFIGDGGLQMNIQELQTIVFRNLPITIILQNNFGYGIIKQFQDAYFDSRHHASGMGYSVPSFELICNAYGIPYTKIKSIEELEQVVIAPGFSLIDLQFPEGALITPKTEMNRFIHDQFPYIQDNSISELPYAYPKRPDMVGEK